MPAISCLRLDMILQLKAMMMQLAAVRQILQALINFPFKHTLLKSHPQIMPSFGVDRDYVGGLIF